MRRVTIRQNFPDLIAKERNNLKVCRALQFFMPQRKVDMRSQGCCETKMEGHKPRALIRLSIFLTQDVWLISVPFVLLTFTSGLQPSIITDLWSANCSDPQ